MRFATLIIPVECLEKIKNSSKGISSLDKKINRKKVEINKKAFKNLVDYYSETKNHKVFEKPIFKLIEKLLKIQALKHQPVNTTHALNKKKDLFTSILIGKNIFQDSDSN